MRREIKVSGSRFVVGDGADGELTLGLHDASYSVIAHLTPKEAEAVAAALVEVAANVRL